MDAGLVVAIVLVDAFHAGRRAVTIARQSVLAGMGLSIARWGSPPPATYRRSPVPSCKK